VLISLSGALIAIFFIGDPFKGLILSQVFLSIQLPFTMAIQIWLTSSKKVMGKYANGGTLKIVLIMITSVVTYLNIRLLLDYILR